MSATHAQTSQKGRWIWTEGQRGSDGEWRDTPQLVFMREPRGSTRLRSRHFSLSSCTTNASFSSKSPPPARTSFSAGVVLPSACTAEEEIRTVTLDDVKAVAVNHISPLLLKRMKKSTADLFDSFTMEEDMNSFLWATLLYFDAFLGHKLASNDDIAGLPGGISEGAKRVLSEKQQQLAQAEVNLGKAYSVILMGQGNKITHHSHGGRLRVSHTHKDQHLYETIYEFSMYVTWITFGYKHWKDIHKELGRFFKTTAFNRDLKVRGEATDKFIDGIGHMNTKSDEYLSYRVYYDRPAVGSLKELHSPVLVSYLPSTKEKHAWAFQPPYHPQKQKKYFSPSIQSPPERLGIIGELMSQLNPDTLAYKKDRAEDGEEDEEEDKEDEEEDEEGEGEEEEEEDQEEKDDTSILNS